MRPSPMHEMLPPVPITWTMGSVLIAFDVGLANDLRPARELALKTMQQS